MPSSVNMDSVRLSCLLCLLISQQLLVQAARSNNESFYEFEERFLKKIFKDYDPVKAMKEFRKNGGTVYYFTIIPDFTEFSEVHLFGKGRFYVTLMWKDYSVKRWSREEFVGRSMITGRMPEYFWRPPAPVELRSPMPKMADAYIYIRNDGVIFYTGRVYLNFHCHLHKQAGFTTFYPHELIGCTFGQQALTYEKWNYTCLKSYYHFFNSPDRALSDYDNCSKINFKRYVSHAEKYKLSQGMKGWRFYKYINDDIHRNYFMFYRSFKYNYVVDILSCTAMAFLTVTQYFVPLSISQRVLVTLFGCLIAVSNLDIISALDNISQRGSPQLTSLALALLIIQTLSFLWTVLANNLEARDEFRLSGPMSERCAAVIAWLKKMESYRTDVNRAQRLVEEADDKAPGEQPAILTGPLIIRGIDCGLGVVTTLSIVVLFGIYLN